MCTADFLAFLLLFAAAHTFKSSPFFIFFVNHFWIVFFVTTLYPNMSQVDLFDYFTAEPVTETWVIENFEKSSNERSYIQLTSSELYLYLNMRPNEDVPDYSGKHVVIYFTSCSDYVIPTFYYRISLINENGLKWNTQEGRAKIEIYGPAKFSAQYIIDRNYLLDKTNGLLPDGKLTIYCEIFELSDNECVQSGVYKDNLVSLSEDNESLLESGDLSDVVLAVGDRELKAHKLILSTRSVVFKKMFEHDLEESKQNRVKITDMSVGACENLLEFIYTGKVSDLEQHVYELYAAADKYQIDSLKSYCELYMAAILSVSTVPKILKLADLYSLEDLKSKCINYITLHSTEFKFKDWQKLAISRPELMYQVFKNHGNKLK